MATIIEIQSDKVDKMNEYATSLMKKGGKSIEPVTKEALDKMLS